MSQTLSIPPTPPHNAARESTLLSRLFALLDRASIPYCVLHGYERFPAHPDGDVDLLMPSAALPKRLARLLREHRVWLNADVVQWFAGASHFIVLAERNAESSRCFLQLHVSTGCDLRRRPLYSGSEILSRRRRRHGRFWIPAADHEFACYLARRIEKGTLDDDDHARRLSHLYRQDRSRCREQLTRIFGDCLDVERIASAAESGSWELVRQRLRPLRSAQVRRATLRNLPGLAGNTMTGAVRVARRWWTAERGLHVVLLGPDGSGKSSVVEAMRQDLGPAFVATERRTFPPALLQRKPRGTTATPHAIRARSWPSSVVRALGYWLIYYTLGHYATVRRSVARGALVLHDRHLVDCLVDPRRYRYGGPAWLLRCIWRCARKPHLVILLDAPAPVIQSRKQEVPLAETERQAQAYRQLVAAMPNGHVVDAARPLDDVISDANDIVLRFLVQRHAKRFGLEPVV